MSYNISSLYKVYYASPFKSQFHIMWSWPWCHCSYRGLAWTELKSDIEISSFQRIMIMMLIKNIKELMHRLWRQRLSDVCEKVKKKYYSRYLCGVPPASVTMAIFSGHLTSDSGDVMLLVGTSVRSHWEFTMRLKKCWRHSGGRRVLLWELYCIMGS